MSLKVTMYNKAHDRFEERKPPKNLLICGIYKHNKDQTVFYKVALFGQSETEINCVFITEIEHTGNYTSLQDTAIKRYCKYFETDNSNLTTLESLIENK